MFHTRLKEQLGGQQKEQAFRETVVKIKKHSLDQASRNVTDIKELQKVLEEQKKLDNLHISLP